MTLVAAPTRAFFLRMPGTTPTSSPPTPAFHWSSFWRMLNCRAPQRQSQPITSSLHHHPLIAHTISLSYRSILARREERADRREYELSQQQQAVSCAPRSSHALTRVVTTRVTVPSGRRGA